MFQWYVINTYSGHENKVKTNLEHRIDSMNQSMRFRRVVVPTEQVIETKDGQKVQAEKRVLPGYVLVNMDLNDEAWTVVKKVLTMIKPQIPGGQANPAPPVGPALGQHGVNIMEFCKAFNAQTAQENGRIIPVEITVFEDRSFTFITKTPPAAVLIKEALNLEKGSAEPNREKVGRLRREQVRQIAETKMPDLNARDIDQAAKIIAGTARSMGVEVDK